jgi:hypothetical protein
MDFEKRPPDEDDTQRLPPDPLLRPGPQNGPPPNDPGYQPVVRSHEERRAIFAQQLQQAALRQLRVESSTDYSAVLVQGKPVNHVLHAILTIFTCALWGIVWIIIAAQGGEKRWQLIVDDYGNVHWQNLG